MELDALDNKAAEVFEGYIVRKDLVRTFARQFPVPTYVVEFMLGRYCASTHPEEIEEGLEIVQRQLASRTVHAGEKELFKARAYKKGAAKLIDFVSVRFVYGLLLFREGVIKSATWDNAGCTWSRTHRMDQQLTSADSEFSNKRRQTRKEKFKAEWTS
ncbi:hypothetical protein GCM10009104_05550 [Marinobacterium maritimum]|uniref:BREX system Lon protease-like BrxL N-terminal domain-containing protein n=1 Tax=Marinobacterium maritimum TaxID=500162 RepID=A0ABP3TD42_9GAMM